MAAVRLAFDVPNPATLYTAGWTQIKVQRSTDAGVTWTEVSRATTRIPLRGVVERYLYGDPTGATTYAYRAVYYNPTTLADHPVPLSITDIQVDAYATVADVRAEGVTVSEASDARVELALDWAARYIDRATRRQFGARYAVQRFDIGATSDTLLLPEPLIAILEASCADQALDLTTIDIYNRHLRGGDRADLNAPQIKISDDLESDDYYLLWSDIVAFERGSQSMKIAGIWGYTEPTRGAIGGETDVDSQVPLDYGVVPPLINWACRALVLQHLFPMYTADDLSARARQITSLRTRDQSVTYSDASAAASSGWAASDAIAEVLGGYGRSISFGVP
jgi:hypothetical protein